MGYIPKRRHGQVSYAPIISSEGRHGLSLGMELRAGNVHASSGAWDFLSLILDKLPSSVASTRTRVRLDGAFYDKKIVESLDEKRLSYVVVARMYRPLKNRMVEARYQEFARGWEAAEFFYTPLKWKQAHRFVAVRRPITLEPEEIQQRLFTFKRYTYHRALVTNLELTPQTVWRFYCDRGFQELLLREFKGSYMPWPRFPPAAFGPMLPTWRRCCGLTTWCWLSSFSACHWKFNTGTSPPCAASFGGCPPNGSDGTIATS